MIAPPDLTLDAPPRRSGTPVSPKTIMPPRYVHAPTLLAEKSDAVERNIETMEDVVENTAVEQLLIATFAIAT